MADESPKLLPFNHEAFLASLGTPHRVVEGVLYFGFEAGLSLTVEELSPTVLTIEIGSDDSRLWGVTHIVKSRHVVFSSAETSGVMRFAAESLLDLRDDPDFVDTMTAGRFKLTARRGRRGRSTISFEAI